MMLAPLGAVHASGTPPRTMSVSDMATARGAAQKRSMPEPDPTPPPPHVAATTALTSQKLYASRTVLVFGEVTTALAESVSAQLLALAAGGSEPIRMLLHSPGGHVEAGDTIHDVIRFVGPLVRIVASGWVASAGALIFAAAPHPHRLALPNTRFLLHQPLGGVGGRASDVEIEARQISLMRARLNRIFADATGQPYEKLLKDTDRNHWMTAEEARDYGLVSRIIRGASEVESP
jgi:ATP-dependent Clp protease, protease subunit